jgi:outer membrane protein TolC
MTRIPAFAITHATKIPARFFHLSLIVISLTIAQMARAASPAHDTDYVPAFFEQAVRNAETGEQSMSAPHIPDRIGAQAAFEESMKELREHAALAARRTPADILHDYLPQEINKGMNAARATDPDNAAKLFSGVVTLEQILGAAVAYSPAIKGAEQDFNAAMNRYSQAEYLNQLVYQYLGFTQSLDIIATPQANKRMTQMSWPFPGSASLQADAVNIDVETARVNFEAAVRDVMAEVSQAYTELLFNEAMAAIVRENLGVARKAEKTAIALYSTGKGMYGDMVMIASRIDKLEAMEQSFTQKRRGAAARLLQTAGLPHDTPLGKPAPFADSPPLSRDAARKAAVTHGQEVRAMELMVRRMDVMVDMAARMAFPDYSLGLSFFQNLEMEPMAGQSAMPNFAVRPMGPGAAPSFASENSYIRELRNARDAAAQKLDDMRNRMAAMADQNYADYLAASNTANTIRNSTIPKTQNAYEAALGSYMSGMGGFTGVLDTLEMLLDEKMELQDTVMMARMARIMLDKTTGGGAHAIKGSQSQ